MHIEGGHKMLCSRDYIMGRKRGKILTEAQMSRLHRALTAAVVLLRAFFFGGTEHTIPSVAGPPLRSGGGSKPKHVEKLLGQGINVT